ncbi:MAG: hypothetical protein J0I34_25490 [Pseudonocardia sp.]|uniref:hypothetical protein n=1 Tax=unclassified Pseudonocardia TaxID=2619320 RepID=UPI000B0CD7CC|nr:MULTISPECIES: hypothetical protein [unclassified Pseudonocardia]MBN9112126.1 hypothetical protein [Pseudonocardia sp.]
MPSHVFVVPGDLTHLALDAWLLPTDSRLDIRPYWRTAEIDEAVRSLGTAADDFCARRTHALPLPDWPDTSPHPVLVAVPRYGVADADDVVEPLTEGLRAAAAVARQRPGPRRYPLVGMPLFGAAGGGGDQLRGRLLQVALDVASRVGTEEEVDVVLVLREGHDLAQAHAIGLAEKARGGTLVPFLGAGISVSAGLPTWAELVERLTAGTDLPAGERDAFGRLPVLD